MKGFISGAVVGGLIGYSKGARAGQQRYDEFLQSTRKITRTPAGRKVADSLSAARARGASRCQGAMTVVMNRAAGLNREGNKA